MHPISHNLTISQRGWVGGWGGGRGTATPQYWSWIMEDCQSWIGNPIHQRTCIPSTPSELQSWAELSLTICTGWKWGIEPATFGVKVQHANHYATVTPLKILVKLFYLCYSPAIRAKDLLLVQTCFSIGKIIFCSLLIYLTLSKWTAFWSLVRWPFRFASSSHTLQV